MDGSRSTAPLISSLKLVLDRKIEKGYEKAFSEEIANRRVVQESIQRIGDVQLVQKKLDERS